MVHNEYANPGGEDVVFANESRLLEANGHTVHRWVVSNAALSKSSAVGVATRALWNRESARHVMHLVQLHCVDVVHFHNTWLALSPSALAGATRAGAAVVQTLHNFRLMCPAATLFRAGVPCHHCIKQPIAWPGVVHACYRNSRGASALAAAVAAMHRFQHTLHSNVHRFIVPTQFVKERFVDAGFPADRVVVKANFVSEDPGVGCGDGGYALFVGRLTEDKGVNTLLEAWSAIKQQIPLKVIGDGPLRDVVIAAASHMPDVHYLGPLSPTNVALHMKAAFAVIVPSLWYETFGLVVAEAFASGTPVIASAHGALAELVTDRVNGCTFTPGAPEDLAEKVQRLWREPFTQKGMREAARRTYEARFTATANYHELATIYSGAVEAAAAKRRPRTSSA